MIIDTSLWSADLANLGQSVRLVTEMVDSFHVDVADGHFAPSLLFFPDLIEAIRNEATVPFHFHLMVQRPCDWVKAFARAGDRVTIHIESEKTADALRIAEEQECTGGVAVLLHTDLGAIQRFAGLADSVLLLGTEVGVKGKGLDDEACRRIRNVRQMWPEVRIYADGGIRRETVPLVREAGADAVVPGSLLFGSADKTAVCDWLRGL